MTPAEDDDAPASTTTTTTTTTTVVVDGSSCSGSALRAGEYRVAGSYLCHPESDPTNRFGIDVESGLLSYYVGNELVWRADPPTTETDGDCLDPVDTSSSSSCDPPPMSLIRLAYAGSLVGYDGRPGTKIWDSHEDGGSYYVDDSASNFAAASDGDSASNFAAAASDGGGNDDTTIIEKVANSTLELSEYGIRIYGSSDDVVVDDEDGGGGGGVVVVTWRVDAPTTTTTTTTITTLVPTTTASPTAGPTTPREDEESQQQQQGGGELFVDDDDVLIIEPSSSPSPNVTTMTTTTTTTTTTAAPSEPSTSISPSATIPTSSSSGTMTIAGYTFLDANDDGVLDSTTGSAVPYVPVRLFSCALPPSGASDSANDVDDDDILLLGAARTDEAGAYAFDGLMPGYYMVVVRPPGGYATSSFWSGGAPGGDVVVDANDDDDAAANNLDNDIDPETGSTACIMLTGEDAVIYRNIGMVPLADDGSDASDFIGGDEPPVTISGIVFRDVDDDGFFDAAAGNDEIGLSDVLVALFVCDDDDGGIELTSSRTAANGQYVFSDLDAGSYLVRFSPPGGYRISSVWSGTVNYADNHANPATSGTACQQYQAGEVANALDAGMSSISKTPTARPSSAPSTWSPSSAPVAAAAPGICNEDGSVGTTTNDAAGSNDKNVQGVNVAFEYAITSVNEAPIDSDQVAKFEDELNTRLACAYFYDDCLSCKVDKKDKAGRVRVRRTSSRARFMFNVNNSSLAGISAFPRDEPVCADDSQSDCSVMNGKFTAYFPDDMTPDAIGQESQQILVIVKNEMEKNDFDGMQVSYIAPLPTVSSAEKVSGSDVEGNGGISNGAMVGIVFALVIFPIALLAILVNLNKKKRNRESLNIRNAVPSGGGRLDSIQQLKQDYYESDSDSSGSSDDLSSVLSGETEEGDSATFSAPSGVSGDTFLSNVAQAPPRGTDEASTSSSSASSASTSSEDEDSTTEISYDDEYETSFDKLVPPRVDDHRDNLQTDDENSAIYKDRSVADEYDGREYSAGRIDEGGGDSMTNRGTRGRGRTRQEDNYTQGQDIEYIPQNYDSKHQSHNNDDYDDEVRSITSADPPGTSYRDLPQENSFDNSQGHFQAYESESNGRGDVNDPFDSVFNHRIQVLPHQSSVDGHHSFQSGNSDGYDGIDSFPQESWESRQSVRSSRSPRLQGQNTRGDPRYVDGGENVNNHDYIQDYIEDNYVDRDGHNYKQDNVSKPPFNDNYHQDSDGYNNGRNTSLQESKGSRRSVHSHRSSQSHGRNKLGDLRYVNDGESLNSQDIARNQDYIDDNYVDREGHNYKQNRPPTPPIDDNYQKDIEYYPQDDENYGDESNDISHDHDYIGDISTEENDSNAGSAATNPRSNKSPGASVGRRGSPNNERYGEDEGGITNLVKSLSDIQTRLASKGKPALPEAVLTQQELAVRTKPTKNPFDMYAHLAPK